MYKVSTAFWQYCIRGAEGRETKRKRERRGISVPRNHSDSLPLQDECCWDAREDLRKPISRQQVEALQTRIADLEKQLKEHGIDPGSTSPGHADAETSDRKPPNDVDHDDASDPDSGADWPESHLVENETGDFQVYGPTSAFRHLSISQHTRTSPTEGSSMPGFRRFLPQDVDLTEEEHELALDRFFRYYAAWGESPAASRNTANLSSGERTHPVLFRQDMHLALYTSPPSKTPHYSPMLHNAILAIALAFSDNPVLRRTETRSRFAHEAKQCVEQEGTSPTVATVQALLHIASYHSTAAEHNLGWAFGGMALRCALACKSCEFCARTFTDIRFRQWDSISTTRTW